MKNSKCKNCKKLFHSCSSCGFSQNWEYSYCSKECWLENNNEKINDCNEFLDCLTETQLDVLHKWIFEEDDELFQYILTEKYTNELQ